MYYPTTEIFGRAWATFTVLLMLGIVLGMAWVLLRARPGTRSATLDACLAALVGGVIVGRLGHVLLNWAYFRDHADEITRIDWQGGLSVHGVVLGALLGLWVVSRWRKLDFAHLLDSAALVIPLLALMGWWGCAANACAYGAPVEHMADYPRLLTWVQPDIYGIVEPRFATQRLGMLASVVLLGITLVLFWRGWFARIRFPLMLLLAMMAYAALDISQRSYGTYPKSLSPDGWLALLLSALMIAILVRNGLLQTKT